MSERKSINKYYPPNFDPRKVPPVERKNDYKDPNKGVTFTVRLMSPFSMQCLSCGEFIYKGRKFNARKELVRGQDYLGIKLHRFNIRCPVCAAEIVFRTDPKTDDYVCEKGAKRNSEPWKDRVREREARVERIKRTEELGGPVDPLKDLERKAYDAKRELEISEALDHIRAVKARIEKVDIENVLINRPTESAQLDKNDEFLLPEEEQLVKNTFSARLKPSITENLNPINPIITASAPTKSILSKRLQLGIVPKKKS